MSGGNESQAFETLKPYSDATTDKEFYSKFERRRPGLTSVPPTPLDTSQRQHANQSFNGDPGAGRARGRESGFWNQRESRFGSIDVASQMVQQGSIPPSLYTGRGLPNVSNAQSASWNTFGLVPAVPNRGLDMLRPMGLHGTLRQPINSSLNANIPRQRCRDFEERGFCLRGDICPMEHGVNRIVIEDVQSLSQFNLPVALPSAHVMGAPAGSGSLHALSVSTSSINNKSIREKGSTSAMGDDGLALSGAYPDPGCISEADVYDPDEPLWNDRGVESSNALLTIQASKIDETKPLSSEPPHDCQHLRLSEAPDSDCPIGTTRTSVSSQSASSSVWARIGGSKNRFDMKGKINSFHYPENQFKEDNDESVGAYSACHQGNQIIADDAGPIALDASLKAQTDCVRNIWKSSQKALRTLFIDGIPQKCNKREALLSHFQKFGEVTDIYIPLNSERAFVQFSKREEAEAALKAPDAVMDNRFIKLWWANRDSIPNDGKTTGSGVTVTSHGKTSAFVPTYPVVTDRGKDIHQAAVSKTNFEESPATDQPKPVIANGPKVPPPLQKKLENLEQLKENSDDAQATGGKGGVDTEQAAKRPKMGMTADVAKLASPQSSDSGVGLTSSHAETITDKNESLVNTVSQILKTSATMRMQESAGLKLAAANRYKLDNLPTTFRVIPPIPTGLVEHPLLN